MNKDCHKQKGWYPTVKIPAQASHEELIGDILNAFIGALNGRVEKEHQIQACYKLKDYSYETKTSEIVFPVDSFRL